MIQDAATDTQGEGEPVTIKMDHSCESLGLETGWVAFSNGTSVQHDLVIGADGIGVGEPRPRTHEEPTDHALVVCSSVARDRTRPQESHFIVYSLRDQNFRCPSTRATGDGSQRYPRVLGTRATQDRLLGLSRREHPIFLSLLPAVECRSQRRHRVLARRRNLRTSPATIPKPRPQAPHSSHSLHRYQTLASFRAFPICDLAAGPHMHHGRCRPPHAARSEPRRVSGNRGRSRIGRHLFESVYVY